MVTSLPAGDFGVQHLKGRKVDVELSICLGRMARRAEGAKAMKSLIGVSKVSVFSKKGWILSRQRMDIGVNGKGKTHHIVPYIYHVSYKTLEK